MTDYRQQRCKHGYIDVSQCEQCASDKATNERIQALEKTARAYLDTISEFHHAMKDAGWHPGRTDDKLTDIIKAKAAEMARLERDKEFAEIIAASDEGLVLRIQSLERENAKLRKDAERLDFYAANTHRVIHVFETWYHRKDYGQMARKAQSLRAAIDAAMQS